MYTALSMCLGYPNISANNTLITTALWFLLRFLWLLVLTLGVDTKDQGVMATVESGAQRIGRRCSMGEKDSKKLLRT